VLHYLKYIIKKLNNQEQLYKCKKYKIKLIFRYLFIKNLIKYLIKEKSYQHELVILIKRDIPFYFLLFLIHLHKLEQHI